MNPTDKWTDERIDDLANEIRPLRTLQTNVAKIDLKYDRLHADLTNCFNAIREVERKLIDAVRDLNRRLDESEDKREAREEEARKEAIAQRRWIIGSAISASGLVIAALAILTGGSA